MLLRYLLTIYLIHSAACQRRPSSRPVAPPSGGGGNPEATDIISQISDISPDGSFYTKWETANGISVEERGTPKQLGDEIAEQVQGSASWTSKEGEPISITWTADENGANFQGAHLPTAPPAPEIPPLIQRALDWIAANPSKDSIDEEGQYREEGAPEQKPALSARRPPSGQGRRF